MKPATATLLALAALVIGSLAARPRVTFDELVGRVEVLERRVRALESPRLPASPPAAGRGPVLQGMSVAEVEAVLRLYRVRPAEKRRAEQGGVAFEHWDFAPAPGWSVRSLMFRDGEVSLVTFFPEGPGR